MLRREGFGQRQFFRARCDDVLKVDIEPADVASFEATATEAALRRSTPASSATGCIASVTELETSPMMKSTWSWSMRRRVAETPSTGVPWLSPGRMLILRPPMPPAPLISFAAI
jgi:hypothetical protein